jgi:hypothetical protein
MRRRYDIGQIRDLATPRVLVVGLGLLGGARREGSAWLVCCPAHNDRSPSLRLSIGPRGGTRAKCFSGKCAWGGDAINLTRLVLGCEFPEALEVLAGIVGVAPMDDVAAPPPRPRPPPPPPRPAPPERPLPPAAEVVEAWAACVPLGDAEDACAYLRGRALDPVALEDADVVRVLPPKAIPFAPLPLWVETWREQGYRLVARIFDEAGQARSLRAWRLDGATPKRKAAAGFRSSGLVLADAGGVAMLRGELTPGWVILVEGEPDLCTWAASFSDADETAPAVLGITGPGSWSDAIAARIPDGAEVHLRTDDDESGETYAAEMGATLIGRCRLYRPRRAA